MMDADLMDHGFRKEFFDLAGVRFDFDVETLGRCYRSIIGNNVGLDDVLVFVLRSCATWCCYYFNTGNVQHTGLVMDALAECKVSNGEDGLAKIVFKFMIEFLVVRCGRKVVREIAKAVKIFFAKGKDNVDRDVTTILIKWLDQSISSEDEEESACTLDILDIICYTTREFPGVITVAEIGELVRVLMPVISRMNSDSFTVLSSVVDLLDTEHEKMIYSILFAKVFEMIESGEVRYPVEFDDDDEPVHGKIVFPSERPEMFQVKNQPTFEMGFEASVRPLNKGKLSLTADVARVIHDIRVVAGASKSQNIMADVVGRIISKCTKVPHFMDMIAASVTAVENFDRCEGCMQLVSAIARSQLFNSKYSMDDVRDHEWLTIRAAVYEIMIRNISASYRAVIEYCMDRPIIMSEFLSSMLGSIALEPEMFVDGRFVSLLGVIAINYQNADGVCIEHTQIIEDTRRAVAAVISKILSDRVSAAILLQSDVFVPVFLASYGFEKATRSFVIECCEKAVRNGVDISVSIIPALEIALRSTEVTVDGVHVWCELMEMLNVLLDICRDARMIVSAFGDQLCAFVRDAASACVVTPNFLVEVIRFYKHLGCVCTLREVIGVTLTMALRLCVSDNEMNMEFVKLLKEIISRRDDIIGQPAMCITLVDAFMNSSIVIDNLRFFIDLCKLAERNCRVCHQGNLDVFLLRALNERKETQCDELVDTILTLISYITKCASSTSVICQYMSLFAPTDSSSLSRYYSKFIAALSEIGASVRNSPGEYILVDNSTRIILSGIRSDIWRTLVTISFQLMVLEKGRVKLIEFQDSAYNVIQLAIVDETLEIEVKTRGKVVREVIPFRVPREVATWMSVTLNCSIEFEVTVFVQLKGATYGPLTLRHVSFTSDTMMTAEIAGGSETASYRLYAFDLSSNGTTISRASPEIAGGKIVIKSHGAVPGFLVNERVVHMHFVGILTALCSATIMLPLFGQLDLEVDDGRERVPAATLVHMLSSFLHYARKAELRFRRGHGFATLSFLLSSIGGEHLTMDLYLAFVTMFDDLTVLDLKKELFEHILMNFGLWTRANDQAIVDISRHWSNVLYTSFMPHSIGIFNFRIIMFALTRFFPHQESRERAICVVRANIVQILEMIIQSEYFTACDFGSLIGQCLEGHVAVCERRDLLAMVHRAISECPEKNAEWSALVDLHHLLVKETDDIVLLVINIYTLLHSTGFFAEYKISLDVHVSIIMTFLMTSRSARMISELIDMVKVYNEIASLIFYIAYTGDDDCERVIMEHFDVKTPIGDRLALWMMMCLVLADEPFAKFIVTMIMESNFSFVTAFHFVRICAIANGRDAHTAQVRFIMLALDLVEVCQVHKCHKELIDIMVFTILYRNSGYVRADFRGSDEGPGVAIHMSTEAILSMLNRIESHELAPWTFGLNFGADGKWVDESLAWLCLQEIIRVTLGGYENIMVLLVYFLKRAGRVIKVELTGVDTSMVRLLHGEPMRSEHWFRVIERDMMNIVNGMGKYRADAFGIFRKCFEDAKIGTQSLFGERNDDSHVVAQIHEAAVFKRKTETVKHENMKRWFHLWNNLAFDGPWKCKVTTKEHFRRWKRDSTLCDCGYPAKFKLNDAFDDHIVESLRRDTGSNVKAASIYEQTRVQTRSSLPTPLVITSDKFKEEDIESSGDVKSLIGHWKATIKKIDKNKPCTFQLYSDRVQLIVRESSRTRIFHASSLEMILLRGIVHRPFGLEMFTKYGRSVLIDFGQKSLPILKKITDVKAFSSVLIQTVPAAAFMKSLRHTDQWMRGEMSNFEYLMKLNILSGRSFSSPSMYPVFPWVIQKYECESFDLKDETMFRDLKIPMGAMDPERIKGLKARSEDAERNVMHLYNSTYSTPLTIFIWLLRMEPFTTLHIKAQGGRFDHANRQFWALARSFQLASSFAGDYRELCPEFFYDPTIFRNTNEFDLGEIDGKPLNDVALPPWAKDPIEFVYLNRKALESEHVSKHLSEWIDLIWGYKQTGQEALNADNAFHPYLYESVWSYVTTPDYVSQVEAMLEGCGQIPSKLFDVPHPVRQCVAHAQKQCVFEGVAPGVLSMFCFDAKLVCCYRDHVEVLSLASGHTMHARKWKGKIPVWKAVSAISAHSVVFLCEDDTVVIADDVGTYNVPVGQETGQIWCVSAARDFIVVGGCDALIDVYQNTSGFPIADSFMTFRDDVVCCDVSSSFDLIVAGTRDGAIFFVSPSMSAINHIVSLEDRIPEMIKITSGWGFVVVYERRISVHTTHCIELFTVNGAHIRRVDIGFDILNWTFWKSRDGFDYLMVVCNLKELRACEVFYLDFRTVDRYFGTAQTISYSVNNETLFVLQNDKLKMLPFRFEDGNP